ncbi:MAG: glycosyltransferase [Lachnospiraceae bacterium]|jgi:glycosyltransferase involved in cell wall biosynthesis|nr:glycosyltransferase [uncultured Acetatifactor sp.]MCI9219205.1 glycosyltransferase [Lachnospiraceae bacterium]
MNDKITIITLMYNSMDVIIETINSIIVQDYTGKIEVIISDDGSTDFNKEKIERYIQKAKKNQNFIIIHSSENKGTVKNLNNAIKISSGEIIIHLSAGDLFISSTILSRIVDEFTYNNCDMICSLRIPFLQSTDKIMESIPSKFEVHKLKKIDTPLKQYHCLLEGVINIASGSAFAYTRDFIFKQGMFDETYRLWEDGPFFSKITKNGVKLNIVEYPTIYYRLGGISTSKISEVLIKDSIRFLSQNISDTKEIPLRVKRIVTYRMNWLKNMRNESQMNWLLLYLKYLDVVLLKILFRVEKRIYYFFQRYK